MREHAFPARATDPIALQERQAELVGRRFQAIRGFVGNIGEPLAEIVEEGLRTLARDLGTKLFLDLVEGLHRRGNDPGHLDQVIAEARAYGLTELALGKREGNRIEHRIHDALLDGPERSALARAAGILRLGSCDLVERLAREDPLPNGLHLRLDGLRRRIVRVLRDGHEQMAHAALLGPTKA